MRAWIPLLALSVTLALSPRPVAAQEEEDDDRGEEIDLSDDPDFAGEGEGEEIDLSDDPDFAGTPDGATENPDDLREFGEGATGGDVTRRAAARPTGYPQVVVERPLTLVAGMSELSLELPATADPFVASGLIRAKYGVTSQVELGIRYGAGSVDEGGFIVGKAVSVDAQYLVTDFLAVQLSVPMLLDPFAMGVTVGAPLKFQIGDKVALIAGRDLVNIRIARFVPTLENAAVNEGLVALDEIDTQLDRGELRFLGGVIYQVSPALALTGETGVIAFDFGLTDAGVPVLGTVTYSTSNKFDLGAKAGFANLDGGVSSFAASAFLAVRI